MADEEQHRKTESTTFSCLWRKPQARKHKTWEGDAILSIRGLSCVVSSGEDGRVIASGSWPSERDCVEGKQFKVEGIEIEIEGAISTSTAVKQPSLSHLNAIQAKPLPTALSRRPALPAPLKVKTKFKSPLIRPTNSSSHAVPKPFSSTQHSRFFVQPTLEQAFRRPSSSVPQEGKRTSDVKAQHRSNSIQANESSEQPNKRVKLTVEDRERNTDNQSRDHIDLDGPQITHHVCLHRKIHGQNPKKHITWDGDGHLSLHNSNKGKMGVLRDLNNGKILVSMLLEGARLNISPGSIIRIGSREVEIQRVATDDEVMNLERAGRYPSDNDWTDVVKSDLDSRFKNPLKSGEKYLSRPSNDVPRFDAKAPGAVVLRRPDAGWELKNNPKNCKVADVVVDPKLTRNLRPHQIEGVKFMYECVLGMREIGGNGCILADEMGLGKSLQAISLVWTLLRQNPLVGQGPIITRAMIVCPVTLVRNWAREINKWLGRSRLSIFVADSKSHIKQFTGNPSYNVLIIGYEKLRTVSKELNSIYPPIGLIIADEGHRLKSIEAKTTQSLRLMKTKRRVVLSGTPIQNNLSEFYAMIDFVNPGILGDYREFKKKFEQPILKSREPYCTAGQKAQGECRADELTRLSKKYVLRRGSELIAQHLPPRHDYCVFISPTEVQRKIYQAILDSPEIRAVFSGDTSQHLVLINTLKKLCNSPGLLMDEGSITSLAQNSSELFPAWVTRDEIKLSGKLMALAKYISILREKNDEKIIIVSNFTKTLDIIEAHCRHKSYPFCRLDGKTPQNQRDNIVQSFNKSSARAQMIFLLSSKSGGVGLNLIGASRLILFDGDWNPATDLQAMARIWRQGQQKPCFIYRFLTTGTMDECIFQRQVTKMGLATDLMSDSKIGEESTGGGNTFTKDELRRLFELHIDTKCHTHDLLGCRCLEPNLAGETNEEKDDEEVSVGSDSEQSLPSEFDGTGFLPASQYQADRDRIKVGKKLVELETWLHIQPFEADSIGQLEDEILEQTINELNTIRLCDSSSDNQIDDDDDHRKEGEITFVFRKTNTVL